MCVYFCSFLRMCAFERAKEKEKNKNWLNVCKAKWRYTTIKKINSFHHMKKKTEETSTPVLSFDVINSMNTTNIFSILCVHIRFFRRTDASTYYIAYSVRAIQPWYWARSTGTKTRAFGSNYVFRLNTWMLLLHKHTYESARARAAESERKRWLCKVNILQYM